MKRKLRIATWMGLATLLAGCITPKEDKWEPIPPQSMPGDVPEWRIVWDDTDDQWERAGSGETVGQGEIPTGDWVAEQEAFGFRVRAAEQLNYQQGSSHTVALYFLQTKNPGQLARQFETPTEVYRLLRRGTDDPAVLAQDREIVEPGRELVVSIDRAERARYVALVVASLNFDRMRSTRIIPVPQVYDVPRGRERWTVSNIVSALNPFSSEPDPRPGHILGWLALGPEGIDDFKMLAR